MYYVVRTDKVLVKLAKRSLCLDKCIIIYYHLSSVGDHMRGRRIALTHENGRHCLTLILGSLNGPK